MSFAATSDQVLAQTKTVTRRVGWTAAVPGLIVQPVLKVMGRRKGEPVVRLGPPIEILEVQREPLTRLIDDPAYGAAEMILEGFPGMAPVDFLKLFAGINDGVTPSTTVNRIRFRYLKGV